MESNIKGTWQDLLDDVLDNIYEPPQSEGRIQQTRVIVIALMAVVPLWAALGWYVMTR